MCSVQQEALYCLSQWFRLGKQGLWLSPRILVVFQASKKSWIRNTDVEALLIFDDQFDDGLPVRIEPQSFEKLLIFRQDLLSRSVKFSEPRCSNRSF